jgi:hypothetical protein
MLKSAIIASAVLFGASVPVDNLSNAQPVSAKHTILNLPKPDVIVAQFSYLEVSHGDNGFDLSVTDSTDVFVDFKLAGKFHIRIGV